MTCFRPLKAYRCREGGVSFDLVKAGADATRPLDLPCGQCIGCRVERSRQWALRCVHEAQMHKANCFVTLTYDNEHLPKYGSLVKKDWQDFAKRLRKKAGPFRFLHCGEYGDENGRPHYHACLFGIDFSVDRVLMRRSGMNALYVSPLLSKTWGLGHCLIGDLSYESAAYVARYVVKKLTGPRAEAYDRVDQVTGELVRIQAPYATMSRRPGLAQSWFDKYHSEVFPSDEVVHKGRRFRPPRFYDTKLSDTDLERVKEGRRARARAHAADQVEERLRVREKVAEAKLDTFSRRRL